MATASADVRLTDASDSNLRMGTWLMTLAAIGFIGYAAIFLVRNFTDSFLELGIGPSEVDVGKDQITQFSPSLYHYISHLHIAVSGFIAATGIAVAFLVWFAAVTCGRGSERSRLPCSRSRLRCRRTIRTTSTRLTISV